MAARGLEIPETLPFHRRQWRFELAGSVCLALLLVAAALGLFGPGLWNQRDARTARGELAVEYPRFWRMQAPLRLRLELGGPELASRSEVRVWLSRDYLADLGVEAVTPEPREVELGTAGATYVFAWDGSAGPAVVSFVLEASRPGAIHGRIGTSAEDAVDVEHFVYP